MKTTINEENGSCVLSLIGRLDTSASVQVEKDMQPLYDLQGRDIVLDCSQLEYISSSGLRLFLRLAKSARAKGNALTIANLTTDIRQVFEETGFIRLFNVK